MSHLWVKIKVLILNLSISNMYFTLITHSLKMNFSSQHSETKDKVKGWLK